MAPTRRSLLTALGAGSLVSAAGCIDEILGSLTSFEASPAEVEEGIVDDSGYDHQGTNEETIEEEFSVASESQTVEVTNHIARYERAIGLPILEDDHAAVFVALATPKVEVLGESFNPVDDMDDEALVAELQSMYEGLSIDGVDDERSVETLDSTAEITSFAGQAEVAAGVAVDVFVDLATIEHGDDFVVVAAVYPRDLPDESDTIDTLVGNLEHDG